MGQYKKVPLTLGRIDEGRFAVQTDEDLHDLQTALLAYAANYGPESRKAKAKLTIEITIAVEDPAEGLCSIKATAKKTTPQRPATVSMATTDEDDDGQPGLFVRPAGSDTSPPRQTKLATDDGRTIDTETGEVLDGPADARPPLRVGAAAG